MEPNEISNSSEITLLVGNNGVMIGEINQSKAQAMSSNAFIESISNSEIDEFDEEAKQQDPDKAVPPILIKEWIPICDEELKPKEGMEFENLEKCENFYKTYAHHVGFSVRKSSTKKSKAGDTKYKYFVCSKQGFKEDTNKSNGKEKIRKSKLTREGCNGLAGFRRMDDGRYVLFKFNEGHTHLLVTPRKHHMLRSNKGVTSVHRTLFKSFTRSNIGTSHSHRIMKEQVGGFQNVGCSQQDLRNFQRDLKSFIKDSDAHMFIENFKRKKEVNPSFYFAHEVDDDGRLKHVFWADGVSRKNYALYGDVVSFDTTYDTNRYKMIFAPFTGVDNHRLSISFGAAFLGDEKKETFAWLFEKFLDAMGRHEPTCIITDQDPAMKAAIEQVFTSTTHRFCIWHIMRKLSEKVGISLCGDESFNSQFKSCVYNSESPEEFESTWRSVMAEFRLEKHYWLSNLYEIRDMWIHAYFKNIFLGGLLRTTSRFESENSFFSNFTNPHLSLVEFWMRFEGAMDVQRHRQLLADHQTQCSVPELKINSELEKYAGALYTFANFYKFQEELWCACTEYEVYDRKVVDEGVNVTIVNVRQKDVKKRQVLYNPTTNVAHCSCKMFEGQGIPCRHILCLLKGLDELPGHYVVNRWTKMAASGLIYDLEGNILEDCSQMDQEDKQIQRNWFDFLSCMQLAGRDLERQDVVAKAIKEVLRKLGESGNRPSVSKTHELESFIGSKAPEKVQIFPPKEVHTKGSGKRIKGGKEQSMEQQQKRTRFCKGCGEPNHNSRTCPRRNDQACL